MKFVDRPLTATKKHAMAIWRHIKAHDKGITNFHFEIGADLWMMRSWRFCRLCGRD